MLHAVHSDIILPFIALTGRIVPFSAHRLSMDNNDEIALDDEMAAMLGLPRRILTANFEAAARIFGDQPVTPIFVSREEAERMLNGGAHLAIAAGDGRTVIVAVEEPE